MNLMRSMLYEQAFMFAYRCAPFCSGRTRDVLRTGRCLRHVELSYGAVQNAIASVVLILNNERSNISMLA